MKKRIIVKRPMQSAELIETEITYRCALKEYISNDRGVLLESVHFGFGHQFSAKGKLVAIVDEDGIPKNLDMNIFIPTKSSVHPIQLLYGNVVFCRLVLDDNDLYDFKVEGLTDADINLINMLLIEYSQINLGKKFNQMYSSLEEYKRPVVFTFEGGEQINGND